LRYKVIHSFLIAVIYSLFYIVFFSPVLFSGRLLAPGDGFTYYLPNFFPDRALWEPLLFSGFPVAADPQVMTWYPVSSIFSFFRSWNSFIISAYVLGSSFTYGYVFRLSQSRLAGFISGLIFGMSGFMMAHLGHTSIIHTAIWMPLFIWALEELLHKLTLRWLVIGILCIPLSIFSGHPQILVYTLCLGTLYVLGRGFSKSIGDRLKYYGLYCFILVFGLSLAAIQIVPSAELKELGMRSQISFGTFNECALNPYQSFTLLFPYLLGGTTGSIYPSYFGSCNIHELSGYVGLLPLLLACIGLITNRKKSIAIFWCCIGIFSFLLALGSATPLANFMYQIPFYNKFRAPARHFIEMTLAVSVLAGLGIAAIQNRAATGRLILRIAAIGAVIMLAVFVIVLVFSYRLDTLAVQKGFGTIAMLPWSNPAVGLPLALFLAGGIILIYWSMNTVSYYRQILLILILITDLGSFGWLMQWRYGAPDSSILNPPAIAQKYKGLLNLHNQRLLTIRGGLGDLSEIPPDISRLWQVPSANGYNPLILSRVRDLLSMEPAGFVTGFWHSEFDRSLDIMGIRYVLMPHDAQGKDIFEKNGIEWIANDMPIQMGNGGNVPHSDSIKLHLPVPFHATAIGIVSAMACSDNISDNVEMVRIKIKDTAGNSKIVNLRAGKDTSEWAYDCGDVLPLMKHGRAPVFESWPVVRKSEKPCEGHKYVSVKPLDRLGKIKSIELQWVALSGTINIKKISLFNAQSHASYPLSAMSNSLMDRMRWRHAEDTGGTTIYENIRAMPRAWLVSEVISTKPQEALYAIKSSKLTDGRDFDPRKIAIVEEPFHYKGSPDPAESARITIMHNSVVEIKTNSQSQSFLVLSDVYYPGWKATIDGVPTHIFQTNYVLRGILVPAGEHVVRFEFRPKSFYIGAGISAVSLFLLFVIFLILRRRLKGFFQSSPNIMIMKLCWLMMAVPIIHSSLSRRCLNRMIN
jgi:Bacterial membrane protein YfhO